MNRPNLLVKLGVLLGTLLTMAVGSPVWAEEGGAPTIDTGDTAWILVSSRPALAAAQVVPPSVDWYTPSKVPA